MKSKLLILISIILFSCKGKTQTTTKQENTNLLEQLKSQIPEDYEIESIDSIELNKNSTRKYIISATDKVNSKIHEYWFTGKKQTLLLSYPIMDVNFKWYVNLDNDDQKEIIRAQGFEDGIDYIIYDIVEGEQKPILYFYPALKDKKHPNEIFWGYPWDIKEPSLNSENKILVSFNNKYENDANITIPKNQKELPFIFFNGNTTQPDFKLGNLNTPSFKKVNQIIEDIILKPLTIEGNYSTNYSLQLEQQPNISAEDFSTSTISINILDKNKKVIQTINHKPQFLLGTSLPKTATTFSADFINKNTTENYPKIVFGDFNFDLLEDFAFINYEGSNAGPQYTYFIQKKDKLFEIDKFLSENMRFFPTKIDNIKKTLTIKHLVGCCKTKTSIFKLEDSSWSILSTTEDKI